MENNRLLHIAVGASRYDTNWVNTDIYWDKLMERLKSPLRTPETIQQFMDLKRGDQDRLKDVGGFVGGTLNGPRRKANSVLGRDIVTLDLDNIETNKTMDVIRRVASLGCAYAVYSTRKHTEYAPRLRVLIPLDKTVTADEYEPIARKLAEQIGIAMCDRTTFEASRLMYWPSCSADSIYVCEYGDAGFCSADGILGLYEDWHDVATWPRVPGEDTMHVRLAAKQEDPHSKRGIVGAFCRTYTITQAMETFLPGLYTPTVNGDRYTYTGGSTTGGAVVYNDDTFLYSHHATDPCSCKLVNAFDLVRLHKYGDADDNAKQGTPVAKLPSFTAMSELARNDRRVAARLLEERRTAAKDVFGAENSKIIEMPKKTDSVEDGNVVARPVQMPEDNSWANALEMDRNGNVKRTIGNTVLILQHDPAIAGKIATDEFAGKIILLGPVPWNPSEEKRDWADTDDAGLRYYLEVGYGITGKEKIEDALTIVSGENKINEVKDYLTGLIWDHVPRLDTLLIDYLGAEDTPYARAATRKTLCAAVARAINGGTKFDTMLILTGPQGLGKSTLLSKLGGKWFSDSLTTFEGKDAAELIQGTWINEIGELAAFSKQETEIIKQFLSKQHDIYRAAYGRRTERHPRRCIFIGTSNNDEFLRDTTGNRRFWPVDVGTGKITKSVFDELDTEIGQIWAEAYVRFVFGEKLYLETQSLQKEALEQQEKHRETWEKEGLIQEFLDKPIPDNWDALDITARRMFLNGNAAGPQKLVRRDKVCAYEIWEECFGMDRARMQRRDSVEINSIMKNMKGWTKNKSHRRYGSYGTQRGYERI